MIVSSGHVVNSCSMIRCSFTVRAKERPAAFFFFFFYCAPQLVNSQFPNQGLNPDPGNESPNPNHQATRELPAAIFSVE